MPWAGWRDVVEIDAADRALLELDRVTRSDQAGGQLAKTGLVSHEGDALDPDLAESLGAAEIDGVLVASVAKGGPADRAGLRRGDILEALDGHPVPHLAEFRGTIGQEVKSFTIWRDGETRTFSRP